MSAPSDVAQYAWVSSAGQRGGSHIAPPEDLGQVGGVSPVAQAVNASESALLPTARLTARAP
jgi:hypothetical protein